MYEKVSQSRKRGVRHLHLKLKKEPQICNTEIVK